MEATPTCPECGNAVREDRVKMTLWKGERLIVIEDIPARVCDRCFEQYYDEGTRYRIDRLGGEGFRKEEARHVLEVPVFSLNDLASPPPEEPQTESDTDASPWVPDWSDFSETG